MANPYYNHGSFPATGSAGASASMRAELDSIMAGFNKLPTLTANNVVFINASGTALEARSGIDGVVIGGTTPAAGTFTTLTLTSGFVLPLGAVGTPSLSFTGDSNNGWWSPGADIQAWSIAGAEAMRLNSTGLGLGGSPSSRRLTLGNNSGASEMARFRTLTADVDIGATASGVEFFTSNNVPFIWSNNSAVRMTLSVSGNLGIGATPTTDRVLIRHSGTVSSPEGSSGLYINTGNGAGTVGVLIGADAANSMAFVQAIEPGISYASKGLAINALGGPVMIGTSTPVGKFRVDSGGSPWATFGASNAGASYAQFYKGGTTSIGGYIGFDGGGVIGSGTGTGFAIRSEADLVLMSAAAERGRFNSNGALALQAPSAGHTLTLNHTAGSGTGSINTTDGTVIGILKTVAATSLNLHVVSGHSLVLGTNDTPRLTIDSSGNISTANLLQLSRAGVGLQHSASVSGNIVELDLINTSNTANSGASLFMQVAGASAGDNFIRMNINAVQDWSFGVDNSASDSFLFSASSALGSGDILELTVGSLVNLKGGAGALRLNSHISRFESSEQSVPTTTFASNTLTHGGSRVPDVCRLVLRCKTAELGYSVGDEVDVTLHNHTMSDRAFNVWHSTTQTGYVWITGLNVAPSISHKTTGTMTTVTAANWRVVVYNHWL